MWLPCQWLVLGIALSDRRPGSVQLGQTDVLLVDFGPANWPTTQQLRVIIAAPPHTDTHSGADTNTNTHRQGHRHTHTYIQTQPHRHRHRHSNSHSDSHTRTDKGTQTQSCPGESISDLTLEQLSIAGAIDGSTVQNKRSFQFHHRRGVKHRC